LFETDKTCDIAAGRQRSEAGHRGWVVEIPLVLCDPDEVANCRIGYPGAT
jgi:hypothetical protein